MGLPGCLFVCHLILLLVCFLFKYKDAEIYFINSHLYNAKKNFKNV